MPRGIQLMLLAPDGVEGVLQHGHVGQAEQVLFVVDCGQGGPGHAFGSPLSAVVEKSNAVKHDWRCGPIIHVY